jgi:hypothetical protein
MQPALWLVVEAILDFLPLGPNREDLLCMSASQNERWKIYASSRDWE